MKLLLGDCLDKLKELEENSVDSIVTDPPYGLEFMGKDWDGGVPGKHFWEEAIRVAKPGAYLLSFGGTRTFHRLTCAIEDAGWEIRDCVMWVYGSGFPKSHNVGKAIDKIEGNEREVVGEHETHDIRNNALMGRKGSMTIQDTKGNSLWEGWGTALKPAWEPIILARKPLEGTVADNVKKWGTGAMNIEASRVGIDVIPPQRQGTDIRGGKFMGGDKKSEYVSTGNVGRWPANLIHDGSEEVVGLFPSVKGGTWNKTGGMRPFNNNGKDTQYETSGSDNTVGSAARFFYCAKASKADRDEGLEGFEEKQKIYRATANGTGEVSKNMERFASVMRNNHPTVKPTALMRYLCKLVTRPGGVVLDPFMGSGSTGKAAKLEGFDFIGIEKEEEYLKIAKARINAVQLQDKLL